MHEITVEELKARLDRGEEVHLLDVREAEEVAVCPMPGAEHIPMMELFTGMTKTAADPGAEIVVLCHHGIRSSEAVRFLRMQGYAGTRSLAGGIDEWAASVDEGMKRY